jgi:hypothetical protein
MADRENLVVIEVSGGVAYVAKCPPGIEVEIIDYDNIDEPDVDELQENQDFAQDDDFSNMSAEDLL